MTAEQLFSVCSMLVVPGWVLLAVAPRWKWTYRLVFSGAIPLILAAVYVALVARWFARAEGGFGSLAEVAALFGNPWVLLAGWVHYLAFDLLIGCWIVQDAARHRLWHVLVVPCLFLTFLFGPAGLLTYWILRGVMRRRLVLLQETG